ncbi:Gx transporter family protein [Halothermothrix orenii]|uniref:Heptaprenyl diphosphate synthase component I n=1 Tax=Halothermothrix orenii (strain H 168 / OCM 544 / DSM 9562) TaxID=373903 RepID=B8CY07_HALOH|nr:Gx transporter family protein [Halothermothrix orenii]ACL70176.1 heptaprenyl diphosphate synthase component I [Halothermothrix orenii H 168]
MKTHRVVTTGLLVSMGLILHFVESMIPMSSIVPGAKLGLANIVSLVGLVLFGFQGGFQILLLRILIGSLMAGTFMTVSFYLSLSGGIFSFLAMFLAYTHLKNKFSLIGISVIGAIFHNLGQVITAYFVISNPGIFYYLPYLVLMAIPTGIGVGLASYFTVNYLPETFLRGSNYGS